MLKARIIEDCYEYRVDAVTTEFRMEFSVVEKGELPHTQIFVYTVVVETDPASDVFARVASVSDLKSYENQTRDQVITARGTEYLSSSMSITYPLLNVAVQAKSVLQTRINECINGWVSYRDSFLDDGSVPVTFPTTDPVYEQALKDAYVKARDARIAADAAVVTAEAALTIAENDADNAAQILVIYQGESAFCAAAKVTDWDNLNPAISLFKSVSKSQLSLMKSTFVLLVNTEHPGSVASWPPDSSELAALDSTWNAWYNEIVAWEGGINSYGTVGDPLASDLTARFTSFCLTATASVVSQANLKIAKDAAVTSAVQAKQEAEALAASASVAETAALAAVLDVCPDFDSSSV